MSIKSVFAKLANQKKLIILEAPPANPFKDLMEAAQLAEETYSSTWERVGYGGNILLRKDFMRHRRNSVLRGYINSIITEGIEKGMDFIELRDHLVTKLLG